MANTSLIAVRPQGHNGADDTPPAAPINGDEHWVSPPAAPVANVHFSTPVRTIRAPSPFQLPPFTTYVATTQPPASVTLQAHGSSTLRPEHAQENPHPPAKDAVLEDVAQVENNLRLPRFEFNSFPISTPNMEIPYCILDLVCFLESCIF